MSTVFTFLCEGCGYSAQVAGESSTLFSGQTETLVCKDCNSLFDGVKGFAYSEEGGEDVCFSECFECGSEKSKRWSYSKKPCPKCGVKMEVDPYAEVVEAD